MMFHDSTAQISNYGKTFLFLSGKQIFFLNLDMILLIWKLNSYMFKRVEIYFMVTLYLQPYCSSNCYNQILLNNNQIIDICKIVIAEKST